MQSLKFQQAILRNRVFNQSVKDKKAALIDEAISLPGNPTDGQYIYHDLWSKGRYKVSLGKFGKEYYLNTIRWASGQTGNNPNDMKPTIFIDNNEIPFDGSFDHIFVFFQEVSRVSLDALRVLGCLMYRNSLLEDHKLHNGNYRYEPPADAVSYINSVFPFYDNIPTEAYLHYIEAIALNEDVKYSTLGYDINSGTGRKNNLQTYAHVIAVLLGEAPLSKLCSQFSRPPVGVSPISIKQAQQVFKDLDIR